MRLDNERTHNTLVSYASTKMAELLTTVQNLILYDSYWKEMARSLDGTEMYLRALLFGGHAYVPGAANTTCLLSMLHMHIECRVTAILAPLRMQAGASHVALPALGGEQPAQLTHESQPASDPERTAAIDFPAQFQFHRQNCVEAQVAELVGKQSRTTDESFTSSPVRPYCMSTSRNVPFY